jgi:DNA processing protein
MAVAGMSTELANRISSAAKSLVEAQEYVDELHGRDIHTISRFDDDYPKLFFELNDPPPMLYFRGRLPDADRKTVAIVGADNATNAGIELTVKLASMFIGAGVQVVSSLNIGIDASVHLGARKAGGDSYALLEAGFDHIYPEEHMSLAIDISEHGGAITEYPPERDYSAERYIDANRLIVALAHGVVVTEVYKDSTRMLDLLSCCSQIGKLLFMMVDPGPGALADEDSLAKAVSFGAIPMVGWDKVNDIVDALV